MARITSIAPDEFDAVTAVWEASVRATHHFLTEADIAELKPLVPEYLGMVRLVGTRDQSGRIAGFLGTADGKIEMLFVDPGCMGKGYGRALLRHAIDRDGARQLDVNEQNPGAVGFYKHMGFTVTGRSPLDEQGRPFPILHMELSKIAPGDETACE